MKIAICIPHSYENFQKPFTKSLIGLISAFYQYNARVGSPHVLDVFIADEGFIDHMREILADSALRWGADVLLWLDTDMDFPATMIEKMIARLLQEPTIEAVTGLYTYKTPPFMPHTYSDLTPDGKTFRVAAGFPLNEPFGVIGAGFGALMIKAEVFKRVAKPWFQFNYPTETEPGRGEDLQFFLKAQPINMICDPTINCRHYIQMGFDIKNYIGYNGLHVDEEKIIRPTDEQIEKILEENK